MLASPACAGAPRSRPPPAAIVRDGPRWLAWLTGRCPVTGAVPAPDGSRCRPPAAYAAWRRAPGLPDPGTPAVLGIHHIRSLDRLLARAVRAMAAPVVVAGRAEPAPHPRQDLARVRAGRDAMRHNRQRPPAPAGPLPPAAPGDSWRHTGGALPCGASWARTTGNRLALRAGPRAALERRHGGGGRAGHTVDAGVWAAIGLAIVGKILQNVKDLAPGLPIPEALTDGPPPGSRPAAPPPDSA
jgi:hypothetical protein